MVAILTIKRAFSPLARCRGFAVLHCATGEAAWDFTELAAIDRLMRRLGKRGYYRHFVTR